VNVRGGYVRGGMSYTPILNPRLASRVYKHFTLFFAMTRATTCLKNVEMSGNLTAVREKSCQGKVV